MTFTQKVYYNDRPLILTTDSESFFEKEPAGVAYQLFNGATIRNLNLALHQLEMPGATGVIVQDESVVTIQESIHDLYTPVDAAGGVTYNEAGGVLMIFRRGKWDLPKGKRDDGESMDACALREVSEETGLTRLQLERKICDTYHIYAQDQELIMKRTTWYKMFTSSSEKLKPQKEENIVDARWVAEHDMLLYASKTYEAVREVLRLAGLKW